MNRTLLLPLLLIGALLSAGCVVEYSESKSASGARPPRPGPASVPPTPPTQPAKPTSPRAERVKIVQPVPAIRFSVQSDKPQSTPDKARLDALEMARVELMRHLQRLDPPVYARPTLAKISSEFVRRGSEQIIYPTDTVKDEWRASKLDPNRVWMQLDVEVSEEQIQSLRSGDRVSGGFRGAGVVLALLAAVYGFLRLDAWSRGYLTSWLAIGGVAAVIAAALLLLS